MNLTLFQIFRRCRGRHWWCWWVATPPNLPNENCPPNTHKLLTPTSNTCGNPTKRFQAHINILPNLIVHVRRLKGTCILFQSEKRTPISSRSSKVPWSSVSRLSPQPMTPNRKQNLTDYSQGLVSQNAVTFTVSSVKVYGSIWLVNRCYLKLGTWMEEYRGLKEETIPVIINFYDLATKHDKDLWGN